MCVPVWAGVVLCLLYPIMGGNHQTKAFGLPQDPVELIILYFVVSPP